MTTDAIVTLVLLALILTAGIAAALGHSTDSRDPEFSLGRVIDRR